MKQITYIALFLSLMLSCSQQNKYKNSRLIKTSDFKIIKELHGTDVSLEGMLMKPLQLQVYDTLLILGNSGTEKFFDIYNLKTGKLLGQRISLGQGPKEMIFPFFISDKSSIALYDMGTSTISKFTISDFASSTDPTPYEQKTLSENILSEVIFLGDNIIGSPFHPQHPFYIFDKNGNKAGTFGAYPVSDISYSDAEKVSAYQSILTSNSVDKIAICYFWTDLIEIYTKEGVLENRIHGPEHFFPHFKEIKVEEATSSTTIPGISRDAYYSPVSVGEYIFVLFNGKYPGKLGYNILADQIFVFNWDGVPQRIYNLDQGVLRIAVDEKNRKIYGISDDPDYKIIEFQYD